MNRMLIRATIVSVPVAAFVALGTTAPGRPFASVGTFDSRGRAGDDDQGLDS
jgi:hypothetical protein